MTAGIQKDFGVIRSGQEEAIVQAVASVFEILSVLKRAPLLDSKFCIKNSPFFASSWISTLLYLGFKTDTAEKID